MLRILLVEDSADDAELLRLALEEGGLAVRLYRVETRAELKRALDEAPWDLVVCDHHLPDLNSLAALDLVRAHAGPEAPPPPVIVMSGHMATDEAVEALRRGARDCMPKHELPRLLPVLQRELASARTARALRDAQDDLRRLSERDPVTGLLNRVSLEQALNARLGHGQHACALLLIEAGRDNPTLRVLGPAADRQWQTEMARRLSRHQGPDDLLARLDDGGFALLLAAGGDDDTLSALAGRLRATLERPFSVAGYQLAVSSSIGAHRATPGDDAERMLLAASAALCTAAGRRGGYCLHTPQLRQHGERRLALESALHQALDCRQFTLHYQPQTDLASGRVVGAEALLRWQHPTLGMVSPMEFIPILEDSGLIIEVGRWVLQQACLQAVRWQAAGLALDISVNLSPLQFGDPGLVRMVTDTLSASGLPPRRLELEITESVAVNGEAATLATMRALQALGVRIAMDDFGAGYSSLGYLKRFPIDTLKIDRAFITDLADSEVDRHIVHAIVTMGHSLGLQVVAEGIETEAQRAVLLHCACDIGQGYLISRPLTAEAFEARVLGEAARARPAA